MLIYKSLSNKARTILRQAQEDDRGSPRFLEPILNYDNDPFRELVLPGRVRERRLLGGCDQ